MPTRNPVNGPGPQPTTTASRSVTEIPASAKGGKHIGRQLFGVRAGVDGDPLGEHVDAVTVAPHDSRRDGRRRGVDREDDLAS